MRTTARGAILVVAASLWLCAGAAAQPARGAEVVLARPPVEAVPRGQTAARPLVKGARLAEGDRVRTGRGGAAEIRLGDGSLVRLGELSDLEIDKLDLDAAGNPSTSRFNLAVGQARAWVARQVIAKVAATQGGFAVQTPTAVAAVRQTDFAVLHESPAIPDAPRVSRVYTFAGQTQNSSIGAGFVLCDRNRWTRLEPRRDPPPCTVIPLRDKRAILKALTFESATVDPADLDLDAFRALGGKLTERLTGDRIFGGQPGQTGRGDAPSTEAPVGTSVSVE